MMDLESEISYSDYCEHFEDDAKEFETKGLCLSDLNGALIDMLLKYGQNNYQEACQLFRQLLNLDREDRSILEGSLNIDLSPLKRVKCYKFYKQHINFFKELKDRNYFNLFFGDFSLYMGFMSFVLGEVSKLEDYDDYFNQVMNNLKGVYNLDLDKVYLILNTNQDKVVSHLDYKPQGSTSYEVSSKIIFKEENLWTDGKISDEYAEDEDGLLVFVDSPLYIIKSSHKKGYNHVYGSNFDRVCKEMFIYNLRFDYDSLPSKEELNNFEFSDNYLKFVYRRKEEFLKFKLNELGELLEKVNVNLEDVRSLALELDLSLDDEYLDLLDMTQKVKVLKR